MQGEEGVGEKVDDGLFVVDVGVSAEGFGFGFEAEKKDGFEGGY